MKLHILSDIHLEFADFTPPKTDVIVLADDIGKVAKWIHWGRRTFPDKPILYVPGSHEFYGTQRSETRAMLSIAAKEYEYYF